ncbi:MAG TPA: nucleoside-diphosphate sugar epimerase/dehydratase, partial [Candidatus Ozemobacteraceae bacterium]|nr:nucleoside-diphosphate sugar epimerase/dehydratase [Candidatus Ozemobacteraceae bacterium]
MKRFAAFGRLARMMRFSASIPNRVRRLILLTLDTLSLTFALLAAIWLRFEQLELRHASYFLTIWVAIIPLSLLVFSFMGLYRRSVRFTSISDLVAIFIAVTTTTTLKLGTLYFHHGLGYSRSIVIIDWFLSLIFIGFSRLLPRLLLSFAEYETVRAIVFGKARNPAKRVLIFGAGHAGENVVREILRNENFPYRIVGFLDDSPRKLGSVIHGIEVLGTRQDLNRVVRERGVNEIIIAIPSASGDAIREIVHLCRDTKVKFLTLPGMQEILEGKLLSMQLRDISVEDLLRRAPADINLAEIAAYITGKTVLVTGAGGSIGSEICRQILPFQPKILMVLGKGENSIYQIHQELLESRQLGQITVLPVIADVRDEDRLKKLFHEHRPQIIFHAAAHKHVPLMEANPDEAAKNNVFGTANLVRLAHEFRAERFVMISTDKAVNPTSVMGATKRAAEMILKMHAKKSATRFCAVRFGNVLGSRGSVIPLFKKQISRGGPIT